MKSLQIRLGAAALAACLMLAATPLTADLTIEFETVARSGDTPIPGGSGLFTGFGAAPAIDAEGNVVFTATGNATSGQNFQSGVYTFVDYCCQKVADRTTLVPGGGGARFDVFRGADYNDIDGGRVAFVADVSASSTVLGVYTNVGQSSAASLVEVALADGNEWSVVSDPWVDGNQVAMRGTRLIPDQHYAFLTWDGTERFANPGSGYIVSPGTQASISDGVAAFRRYKSGSSQLGVYENGVYGALVTLNSTPIPGQSGLTFTNVNNYPVIDRGGLDLAFRGNGSGGLLGVYKRAGGGALQRVADTDMLVPGGVAIPGWSDQYFTFFYEDSIALANGRVAFSGTGLNTLAGIYTDIGGQLDVIVDNEAFSTILLDGVPEQVVRLTMGPKALALTSWGYMLAFNATLANGETVIVRATINDGAPLDPDPTDTFTVYKDYSDNNTDAVYITLNCTSGTVTNSSQWANEGNPAVFTIEGASANATCTATETSVASGYTKNESNCQNRALNSSCTIVNTLSGSSTDSFTVYKDYSDNNTDSVLFALTCSSGTVTDSPKWANEGNPAVFTIEGASANATCTATESSVATGYSKNESNCQNRSLNSSCTIVNTLSVSGGTSFTVYKEYTDNSTTYVNIHLSCTGGTVTNTPQLARPGKPAVFEVANAPAGTTCAASEPWVPDGYVENESDCQDGDPVGGSCTIVNSTTGGSTDSLTVHKDFSDNNTAWVSVSLSCSSGTVTNSPQWAREGTAAVFEIQNASSGATCTATEGSAPAGYSKNETGCQNRSLNSSCTIYNTLNQTSTANFTVYKDYSDNNTDAVLIALNCSSGTIANNPLWANEGNPAVFSIEGASANATCTATESSVATGYTKDESGCRNRALNGSCTIVNTLSQGSTDSFTVYKNFTDNNSASVSVSLSCTSGSVTNTPKLASEGSPAIFSITGALSGATCTAVENSVPPGYSKDESGCQDGDPLNASCTLVNTPTLTEATIVKTDFETGQPQGWSLVSAAAVSTGVTIGQYALRLSNNGALATRSVSTYGYTDVSVTMYLAGDGIQKNDACYAELSTNGGGSWSSVVQITDGDGSGTYRSNTVSPAAADNNSNLRLRYRLVGKGNGDTCWGDEIIVRGTPMGGSAQAESQTTSLGVEIVINDFEASSLSPAPELNAYGSRGFDPGFDQLTGDGSVDRQDLEYQELMTGQALTDAVAWSAFAVPVGAAQPEHLLEGSLRLAGVGDSTLGELPVFDYDFVQIGNHLFPQGGSAATGESTDWAYVIDTGRVWRESADNGYSRAAIPFMLAQQSTGCVRDGAVMFLFDDSGAVSSAAVQLSGGECADAASGLLEAVYTPAAVGTGALDIQAVLACAADNWLPAVQGDGGITLVLAPDNSLQYVLSDSGDDLWLEAAEESAAMLQLCD